MKDDLVTYDTARLAMEKGFKFAFKDNDNYQGGFHSYFQRRSNKEIVAISHWYADINQNIQQYTSLDVLAPTLSLLQKWVREIHGVHVVLIPTVTGDWTFKLVNVMPLIGEIETPPYKDVDAYDYTTYQEALEAGLAATLKQIDPNAPNKRK